MSICVSDMIGVQECLSFGFHDVSHYSLHYAFHFFIRYQSHPDAGVATDKECKLPERATMHSLNILHSILGICRMKIFDRMILAHHPLKLKNFKIP